jgi:hypothetical protein
VILLVNAVLLVGALGVVGLALLDRPRSWYEVVTLTGFAVLECAVVFLGVFDDAYAQVARQRALGSETTRRPARLERLARWEFERRGRTPKLNGRRPSGSGGET